SGDGTIKIWDLRKVDDVETILAHKNVVTDLKFEKENSKFLISSSYDKDINVFSSDSWVKIHTLQGHNDKILSIDISSDYQTIVSGGWDRSVKLWSMEAI
ncbi:hypothetical protein Kpol_1013p37, partial [Vanderwaltozyma polyspora DSM 70294]